MLELLSLSPSLRGVFVTGGLGGRGLVAFIVRADKLLLEDFVLRILLVGCNNAEGGSVGEAPVTAVPLKATPGSGDSDLSRVTFVERVDKLLFEDFVFRTLSVECNNAEGGRVSEVSVTALPLRASPESGNSDLSRDRDSLVL